MKEAAIYLWKARVDDLEKEKENAADITKLELKIVKEEKEKLKADLAEAENTPRTCDQCSRSNEQYPSFQNSFPSNPQVTFQQAEQIHYQPN